MYVIQSLDTGYFIAPSYEDGQPEWVLSLKEAGILFDLENCSQIIEDHLDPWDKVQIVNLRKRPWYLEP